MAAAAALDESIALRIGLAWRCLPISISLADFVAILIRAVGQPVSAQRLGRLRLKRLREAARGRLDHSSDESLRAVLMCLRGQGQTPQPPLPQPVALAAGDMPGSIRVACASNRADRIDGPFGSCQRYLVYQVSALEYRLVDIRTPESGGDRSERYQQRLELLADCHVLVALTIGGPAAACLVRAGMHPLRLGVPAAAPDFMQELQQVLESGPAPWLLKIMEASARQSWQQQQNRLREVTS